MKFLPSTTLFLLLFIYNGYTQTLPRYKDSPVIVDNDDHRDVYLEEYLMALGSLGETDLRGIITTYSPDEYPLFVKGREEVLEIARESGLRNLPKLFKGTDQKLEKPASNRMEDTRPLEINGSQFIVENALKCTPEQPLVVLTGGQLTSVANAYLLDPSIAEKVVVMGVFGGEKIDYNAGLDAWAWAIIMANFRVVAIPIGPPGNRGTVYMKPPVVPKARIREELDQSVAFFRWMYEKRHPSNELPNEGDFDGHPAILLTQPDYVTEWKRFSFEKLDGAGRPVLRHDETGNIWQAEEAEQEVATREFWRVMHALNKQLSEVSEIQETFRLELGNCVTANLSTHQNSGYRWSTGNQDVAMVDENGEICATGEGETFVAVVSKSGSFQRQYQVRVIGESSSLEATQSVFHETIDTDVLAILEAISGEKNQGENNIDSRLMVTENRRHLVLRDSGEPFLFLGQTLWSMARRLDREEIIQVLDICKEQGFTAIQVLAHGHYMGANPYGKEPFENEKFLRPHISVGDISTGNNVYDWWDHLEFVVEESVNRGLFVCLLPTWREQWHQKNNLNPGNALAYGMFIGQRFRHHNPWIIWVMGGDHHPENEGFLRLHRDLAKGVSIGVNGKERYDNLMMTYHTHGPTSTVDYFPEDEPFMHFNTIQSGHSLKNLEGMIEDGYARQLKPIMDFEPHYTQDGENTDEVRATIYWGVFAGGFGTSYGSWNVWHCGARNDLAEFRIPESFHEGGLWEPDPVSWEIASK
ncbi:apiosidase-like domain-containing protein [Pleomorphovibrio marinus]|uniref:apiosidase-like domain-containing protein n=1 Tax=Pleomorphovibrio marinus TaxID=2164132 RepID=UPI000E0A12F1|nr:DUF4038 domain-containing protein [Pleomorphovibrio marinus]